MRKNTKLCKDNLTSHKFSTKQWWQTDLLKYRNKRLANLSNRARKRVRINSKYSAMLKRQPSSMLRIKNECYVLYELYKEKIYQIFFLFSISNLVLTSFSIWLKRHKNVHSFPLALTDPSSLLYFTQNSKNFDLLKNISISFAWRKYFPILGSLFPKINVLILFVKTSINLSC